MCVLDDTESSVLNNFALPICSEGKALRWSPQFDFQINCLWVSRVASEENNFSESCLFAHMCSVLGLRESVRSIEGEGEGWLETASVSTVEWQRRLHGSHCFSYRCLNSYACHKWLEGAFSPSRFTPKTQNTLNIHDVVRRRRGDKGNFSFSIEKRISGSLHVHEGGWTQKAVESSFKESCCIHLSFPLRTTFIFPYQHLGLMTLLLFIARVACVRSPPKIIKF